MPLYFAYGANMDVPGMGQRCPGARLLGKAHLDDHCFVVAGCGYASVEARAGGRVLGLLWDLEPRHEAALDLFEDVAGGLYVKEFRDVVARYGVCHALIYRVPLAGWGVPQPGYLEDVIEAARAADFPQAYLAELQRRSSREVEK